MRTNILAQQKSIHLFLILSMLSTFFVMPTPAKAGIFGNMLNTLRPFLNLGGKVAGAVIGASLCSAFVPPLGMIAGGIVGWIAGGIITSYGTASLTNLATLAAGAAGAMALGPSVVGMIGGFLLGGFLGRVAMGLLYKADRTATGGILFQMKNALPFGKTNVSNSQSPSGVSNSPSGVSAVSANQQLQTAQENYQKAYQNYVNTTNSGASAQQVQQAQKNYMNAYQEYQKLSGK